MGQVVEQGTGAASRVVGPQLFEHGPLESLHQFSVGLLGLEPIQGQPQKTVQGPEIRIGFGGLFDGLGKVGGRENPGVGLAQARAGTDHPGFPQMVEAGAAGGFPADFTLVKKVQMTPHGTAGLGRPFGQGSDHPVGAGEPDGQEAGLTLTAEMEQNPFILKWLAQVPSLAEGANREDKRHDSGWENV